MSASKSEIIRNLACLVATASEALSVLSGNDGLTDGDELVAEITHETHGRNLLGDISHVEDSLDTIIGDCRRPL